MKNKIEDLRNHMFEALERLKDAETPEELQKELDKSKAIAELGKVLVDTAKAEVDFQKATGGIVMPTEFFNQGLKKIS
jgi:hypothetical protein